MSPGVGSYLLRWGVAGCFYSRGDNKEINKWLDENPLVLVGGAIVLGLILLGIGINAIKTQQATTKRGGQLEGGQAVAMGWVWTVFGGICLLFGLYKCIF